MHWHEAAAPWSLPVSFQDTILCLLFCWVIGSGITWQLWQTQWLRKVHLKSSPEKKSFWGPSLQWTANIFFRKGIPKKVYKLFLQSEYKVGGSYCIHFFQAWLRMFTNCSCWKILKILCIEIKGWIKMYCESDLKKSLWKLLVAPESCDPIQALD